MMRNLAFALSSMALPDLPMATGVLYDSPGNAYEAEVASRDAKAEQTGRTLNELLHAGFTWRATGGA